MKTRISILIIPFLIITTTCFSQEKSKKELKEEKKIEKQKQIESMVNAKEFVFVAIRALPTGYNSVDLTTNPNFVKFKPEMIDSDMPYFGRAYSAVGYGGDTGLKFKGKPDKFTVVKNKKNFQIDAEVRGETDLFRLSLQISFEGSTSLTITSNNRSSITYSGEISAPEKAEGK